MARVLTGIQSSGKPHLGNVLGAIKPALDLAGDHSNESFFFIADLHSLTTIKNAEQRKENIYAVAAAWLALGFDSSKNFFYRQSDLPQVTEFTWYLSCFSPFPMLANAHSFKDKSDKLSDVNAGLFTYPVLMSADILLYDADKVPVGKDQKQHLEMTRDIAGSINHYYQKEILKLPESIIREEVQTIPGTDGQKMSKSYGNTIDIFLPQKQLKKQVMSIVTDSTPLEEPKDPDICNVYKIYELLANQTQTQEMRTNYQNGGYGYGHAKKALLELILEQYANPRAEYDKLMSNKAVIENELKLGAGKVKPIADEVLGRLKTALGF